MAGDVRRDRLKGAAMLAALGTAVHAPLFLRQPVLAEARTLLFNRGRLGDLDLAGVLTGIFEPTGTNSRFVSKLSFRLMADTFGYVPEGLNLVQILLVIACAVLTMEYVRVLSGSVRSGVVVAVLWLLSAGTANALTWQATNHEKLALFFSLIAALVLGRSGRGVTLPRLVALNVSLTFLLALAINSKEIAFFLSPFLVVQAVVTSDAPSLPRRLASVSRVALPTLYFVGFAALYFVGIDPSWSKHAFRESPWGWIAPYSYGLVNLVREDFSPLTPQTGGLRVVAGSILVVGVVSCVVVRLGKALGHSLTKRTSAAVVLGAWFLGSFVIILQQGASLYCLLVPSVGFLGIGTIVIEDLSDRMVRGGFRVLAIGAWLAWFGATFVWMCMPGQPVGRHVSTARRVAASHAVIRRTIPNVSRGHFVFVQQGSNARMRWLFLDPSEQCLMNFVLRRSGTFSHAAPRQAPSEFRVGTYYLVMDRSFELLEILDGSRTLYARSGSRPAILGGADDRPEAER